MEKSLNLRYSETVIAFFGQEATHARHWMQSDARIGTALGELGYSGIFCNSKTFTGQTLTQVASPSHFL